MGRLFEAARQNESKASKVDLPLDELRRIGVGLTASLDGCDAILSRALGDYPDDDGFIVHHSLNVAILSLRVGQEMGFADSDLMRLSLAALLHDIGAVRLPGHILSKPVGLSEDEWQEMRKRPYYSREMIAALGPGYETLAEIAYQVHERADGSGYPEGLKEDAMAPAAQIIGAADFYEACIHDRPYRTATDGFRALLAKKAQFSAGVVKAVVDALGFFPVGSFVELCNGEVGRVLEVRRANPSRPLIEVLLDGHKKKMKKPRRVDLVKQWQTYVGRPLSIEHLKELGPDCKLIAKSTESF
ncbi:MAG: HD-GYP domain-containing protein [Acidobacteriota bacterium]